MNMDAAQITLVVGAVSSVLAFLGTIANMVNTNYKESRARRWAQEDASRLAVTVTNSLESTKREVTSHFVDLEKAGVARLKHIVEKIDANTEVSKEAFKEANGVNEKILSLGMKLNSPEPKEVIVVNAEPIDVHPVQPLK